MKVCIFKYYKYNNLTVFLALVGLFDKNNVAL